MTPTAYAIACIAVLVFVAMSKHIEDLKRRLHDEMEAHERTREAYHQDITLTVQAGLLGSGTPLHDAVVVDLHRRSLRSVRGGSR